LTPETISDQPNRNVVILAEHEDITITWSRFSPGERGPDLHVHHEHTDAFYGELTLELGPQAESVSVGPGGFVAVPAHLAHSFVNASGADARWLNFHAPDCGFADFLRTLRAGSPGQWDSFDAPSDGGLAPSHATISRPGEGLLKCDLPELWVAERDLDGPYDGSPPNRYEAFYVIEGELEMTIGDALATIGPGTLASNTGGRGSARVLSVRGRVRT
jgi:uncharacterized cupin superfamily protein